MGFRLEHSESIEDGVRRVARERLDDAIGRLDGLADGTSEDVQAAVHGVRKRCKELRGLIRLVRPSLGDDYRWANRALREAAERLSSTRDAQVLVATLQQLGDDEREVGRTADEVDSVQRAQAHDGAEAARALQAGEDLVAGARERLVAVRRHAARWEIADDFEALAPGLERTYRRGRRALRRARRDPADEHVHQWRKPVKYLWYQMRLLEPTAPSALAPFVARLDDLADALGDDHDLAVLIARLESEEGRFGDRHQIGSVVDLARERQVELRARAFGLGARLYAEPPGAFVARVGAYWKIDRRHGVERRAGGLADLAGLDRDGRAEGISSIERERTFLLAGDPPLDGEARHIRQGYLAVDGTVSARVRDMGESGQTMTIKAGSGSTRTELEWDLDRDRFEALWPLAEGRCVDKTRHLVPIGEHTAEVDEFAGALAGLWLVEVEFESDGAMRAFQPPPWFGDEVTNDVRYTNAHLAVHGRDGLAD